MALSASSALVSGPNGTITGTNGLGSNSSTRVVRVAGAGGAGSARGSKGLLAPLSDAPPQPLTTTVGGGRPRKPFAKKDLIEAVRRMGPLSQSTSSLKLEGSVPVPPPTGASRSLDDSDLGSQLRTIEAGVNTTSRRYNELKISADRKAVELQDKLDTLAMLKVENDALRGMQEGRTPESSRIEYLRKELEAGDAETNARLHYRRVLEHMLRRLNRNQVRFNARLNGMEEAMQAAQKEELKVEDLTRQLETGRTQALHELQAIQREFEISRQMRDKAAAVGALQAAAAKRMEAWRTGARNMRTEMVQALRGDLTLDQERTLIGVLHKREAEVAALRATSEDRGREVAAMEATYACIRQATGAATLDEIVAKFANQATNMEALEREKCEVEKRAQDVRRRREELEQHFMEIKANGMGTTELNRDITNQLNAAAAAHRSEVKAHKAAHERISNTLLGVRQGAHGLCQRLSVHMGLLDQEDQAVLERIQSQTSSATAEQVLDSDDVEMETIQALSISETLLGKMLEVTSAGGAADGGRFTNGVLGAGDVDEDASDLHSMSTRGGGTGGQGGGGHGHGALEDIPHMRNNIRVSSEDAKVKQERSIANIEETDRVDNLGGGIGNNGSGDITTSDDEQAVDDLVPSRSFLKLCSMRQHTDNIRKHDNEERKRALVAKLEAADENEKVSLTSKLARKKQQERAMIRISQPTPTIGLPEGVTQRDDVYVKTKAFLTQPPELD